MKRLPKSIIQRLDERRETDSFRTLQTYAQGIDFFSNDYLGLARKLFSSNLPHGATGSRLISGNFALTEELEKEAALFFNQPCGVLFNSGYDANLGLFSALARRDDTVIYDELCHASIRDGIRLSRSKGYKFKHNNLADLESKLQLATGDVYVVVESIYSMDGDAALLEPIVHLCEEYKAYLIVDEAHACGLFGENGAGLVSDQGLDSRVFAKLVTFGKAFGSHGAMVLGDENLGDFLLNFSRSLIYTTAMPPASQARIKAILNEMPHLSEERERLQQNIRFFNALMQESYLGQYFSSNSAIQGVLIPGNTAAKAKAVQLVDAGFLVKAILSPTVPKGQERIRICLHSFNTTAEITALIKALA